MIADDGTFEEWNKDLVGENPMDYKGYPEKLAAVQDKTNLTEAVVTGKAEINGMETVIGVCDGRFLMSSMGEAVGEKIARAVERATKERLPVILLPVPAAQDAGGDHLPYADGKDFRGSEAAQRCGTSLYFRSDRPHHRRCDGQLCHAGRCDPGRAQGLIGFAGPRVIEQTIGQKLPKGFQRSEFLLEHGFIDRIVEREELKTVLSEILQMHQESGRTYKRGAASERDAALEEQMELWQLRKKRNSLFLV